MNRAILIPVLLISILVSGCYSFRSSSGGGQTKFVGPRHTDPRDIALPDGYVVEVVAEGLTFPTGLCFDNENRLYVIESGYSYGEVWTTPRLLRIEPKGGTTEIAAGRNNGPWTGVVWHEGSFFVAEGGVHEGGRILRISADGDIQAIVEDLPSHGDHHTDGPAVSSDGWIYFGQGTASNSAVIGKDNSEFGWLTRHPNFHDVPGQDIILTGRNFETEDFLNPGSNKRVLTGAFSPFGTPTVPGQVIRGAVKCNGAILRVRPDGTQLELVAWGFRNPFGLAFAPDGKLYATENSYDDRGSRPVWGTADVLWEVRPDVWYGWPDYSAGEPLNQNRFRPPGNKQPKFLLARHPNEPPKPIAKFAVHASADGLDFSRNERFGYPGDAFVALLGDEAPTVGKVLHPAGFKVVRVEMAHGVVHDFAVNKGNRNGPASKIGGGGFERPVAVRFNPDGDALYVADFGVLLHHGKGALPRMRTGVIWKITRQNRR